MKRPTFLYLQAKFDGLQMFNGRFGDRWKEVVEFYLVNEQSSGSSRFTRISIATPGKAG